MGLPKEWMFVLALATLFINADAAENETNIQEGKHHAKAFSIFSVVTFKNEGCRSLDAVTTGQSPFRNGTCFPASECMAKGGKASGNCASGFGVCCIFLVSASGTKIDQNCTYIRNPGFPAALTATTAISYTVNKIVKDICWLRLDFESMTLAGPVSTSEPGGGTCPDTFKITSSANQAVPTICGVNTGQHIYVDMGPEAADTAGLAFTFDSTVTTVSRAYEIKVSQIQCSNLNRPPSGCLQYWTTPAGRISTFNFFSTGSSHLVSQDVTACIRRNAGYCCVQYQVCEGVPNAFTLDSEIEKADATPGKVGLIDTLCTSDYITIPASSTTCSLNNNAVSSKYCGYALGFGQTLGLNQPICDCTAPFRVSFHTDNEADIKSAEATFSNRGVCLDYQQIPCTTN